jgi:hypothetical protein
VGEPHPPARRAVRGPVAGRGGTGASVQRVAGHPCRAAVCPGSVPKRAAAGASPVSCRRSPAGRRFGKRDDAAEDVPRGPVPSDACGRRGVAGAPEPGRAPRRRASAVRLRRGAPRRESVSVGVGPSGPAGTPAASDSCGAPGPRRAEGAVCRAGGPGSRAPRPGCHVDLPCPRTPRTALVRVSAAGGSGGVEGRGGMEARRASVLMHPPFPRPRRPARRRNPSDPFPACVRVTLRVDAVRVGTSPQARGICPERPPTLR